MRNMSGENWGKNTSDEKREAQWLSAPRATEKRFVEGGFFRARRLRFQERIWLRKNSLGVHFFFTVDDFFLQLYLFIFFHFNNKSTTPSNIYLHNLVRALFRVYFLGTRKSYYPAFRVSSRSEYHQITRYIQPWKRSLNKNPFQDKNNIKRI